MLFSLALECGNQTVWDSRPSWVAQKVRKMFLAFESKRFYDFLSTGLLWWPGIILPINELCTRLFIGHKNLNIYLNMMFELLLTLFSWKLSVGFGRLESLKKVIQMQLKVLQRPNVFKIVWWNVSSNLTQTRTRHQQRKAVSRKKEMSQISTSRRSSIWNLLMKMKQIRYLHQLVNTLFFMVWIFTSLLMVMNEGTKWKVRAILWCIGEERANGRQNDLNKGSHSGCCLL